LYKEIKLFFKVVKMAKEIKLDEETRNKLFGLLPMDSNAVHSFVPDVYKNLPDEFQPVFSIKQLSTADIDTIKMDQLTEHLSVGKKGKKTATSILGKANKRSVTYCSITDSCITGWENLYVIKGDGADANAVMVEYDENLKVIDLLPEHHCLSIFAEITKVSGLGIL